MREWIFLGAQIMKVLGVLAGAYGLTYVIMSLG